MTAFLALVGDSWREARDKRVVLVLAILGFAIVLFFATIRFGPVDPDRALGAAVEGLNQRPRTFGDLRPPMPAVIGVRYTSSKPRAPQPDDDLPLGVEGMRVVEVEFADAGQVDSLCRAWLREERSGEWRAARQDDDGNRAGDQVPVTPDLRRRFFETRFGDGGFAPVFVRAVGDEGRHYLVGAGVERPLDLRHSTRASFCFGAYRMQLETHSPASLLLFIEGLFVQVFSGFLGLLILLGSFASMMPDLLQKGRLDLVLARPIGRAQLVLHKFAGVLLFVLLLWATLFAACSVALGVATGWWSFKVVGCAVTNTLLFAAVFPVTMVAGALMRHASLASLAGLLAWALESAVKALQAKLDDGDFGDAGFWRKAVDALAWILPKHADLAALNERILASEFLSPAAAARHVAETAPVDWWYAGGTTALFSAAFVALACLYVARRDW